MLYAHSGMMISLKRDDEGDMGRGLISLKPPRRETRHVVRGSNGISQYGVIWLMSVVPAYNTRSQHHLLAACQNQYDLLAHCQRPHG